MNTEDPKAGTIVDAEPTVEIVDLTSTALAHFSKTEAALADLRETYGGKVYDCTTNKGDGEARHARLVLKDARVNVEKLRKIVKEPYLEAGRKIDSEAKRITTEIEAIEDPIDAQIKAEEKRRLEEKQAAERAEAERVAKIDVVLRWLRERPGIYANANVATLDSVITEIKAKSANGFDSYGAGHEAIDAQVTVTLLALETMLEARKAADERTEQLRLANIELERQQRELQEQRDAMAAEQAALDKARAEAQLKADDALVEALTPPPTPRADAMAEQTSVIEANVATLKSVMAERSAGPILPSPEAAQAARAEVAAAAEAIIGRESEIPTLSLLEVAKEAHLLLVSLMPDHTTTRKLGAVLSTHNQGATDATP